MVDKLGKQICWQNWLKSWLTNYVDKIVWNNWVIFFIKLWWNSVQCTVYNVHKVLILSLFREPQCSSVWGVELFARLLLCLTTPEDLNEQLSGTSKWSEIWFVGDPKLKWNLVVRDPKMEWNSVVGDPKMEWNLNPEKI